MAYQITKKPVSNAHVASWYSGTSSGSFFFIDSQANNPYEYDDDFQSNKLFSTMYNDGYITGKLCTAQNHIAPAFCHYQHQERYLLLGDENHYQVVAFGLESPQGANNSQVQWRGHVCVTGPESTNRHIYDDYSLEYKINYYDVPERAYKYWYHPNGSGSYAWQSTEVINDGVLSASGNHVFFYCEPEPGRRYNVYMRLKQKSTNKTGPWMWAILTFQDKQVIGSIWSGNVYGWPLTCSAATHHPYEDTTFIVPGRSIIDHYVFIPLYTETIVPSTESLSWY